MKRNYLLSLVLLLIVSSFAFAIGGANSAVAMKTASAKSNQAIKYVGLRQYLEEQDYKVSWNNELKVAIASKDDKEIRVKTEGKNYVADGILSQFSKDVTINNRQILVPQTDLDNFLKSKLSKNKMQTVSYGDYKKLLDFYPQAEIGLMGDREFEMESINELSAEPKSKQSADSAMKKEDHSNTNNQEQGVDEADIVKVDGKYIYVVRKNKLMIIKPEPDMKILHQLEFSDLSPQQLFVTKDKLVVMGATQVIDQKITEKSKSLIYDSNILDKTGIFVYDIKNLEANQPELLRKYFIEGSLNQARCIDDYIYLVSNTLPYYDIYPVCRVIYEDEVDFKAETANPIKTTDKLVEADKVNYFPGRVDRTVLYTIGIDLNDLSKTGIDIDAYASSADVVYVSQNNLYTCAHPYFYDSDQELTQVCRYSLKQGKINYEAQTEVNGFVHNQFSLGEYQNNLRLVLEQYNRAKGENSTAVYIFNENLEQLGALNGLAKGENLHSVRMAGDKIFLVTFEQVDPFFVIDASEVTQPKVLGYLKIPGYSDYMHVYDENTVIGIGNDTHQTADGNVRVDGVKVALFDVSDFSKPSVKSEVVVGVSGSGSGVGWEHKEFMLAKNKNIMAFPAIISENKKSWQAVAEVFNINADKISIKGIISHQSLYPQSTSDYYSGIERIFYVGDNLYTLSKNYLQSNRIDNLKTIHSLDLSGGKQR